MFGNLKKYAPLTALIGFYLVYSQKGFNQLIVDLETITIDKITGKWQNIAIAIVALFLVRVLNKMRFDPTLKLIGEIVLYGIAGYQFGLLIDPPYEMSNPIAGVVRPAQLNPYAYP